MLLIFIHILITFFLNNQPNAHGPTKEKDGTWRVKTNDELDKLIRYKNIINYIKAQRLSWFGHLHRMLEERMVKKVYKWKPMLRRPLWRPKNG
jgi:hypothetical protein